MDLYLLRPPVVLGPHAVGAKDVLPEPVAEMAADPGDGDAVAALRLAIRKAVAADPLLASDLAGMLAGAGAGSMAGGDRSIAAQSVSGIAVTGDGATIVQR